MNTMVIVPNQQEFTVMHASEILSRTPSTIYRWIEEGFIKAERRPKNQVVIRREAIVALLARMDD